LLLSPALRIDFLGLELMRGETQRQRHGASSTPHPRRTSQDAGR
jgi:hypothetical protein